jgi:hypothetical protein
MLQKFRQQWSIIKNDSFASFTCVWWQFRRGSTMPWPWLLSSLPSGFGGMWFIRNQQTIWSRLLVPNKTHWEHCVRINTLHDIHTEMLGRGAQGLGEHLIRTSTIRCSKSPDVMVQDASTDVAPMRTWRWIISSQRLPAELVKWRTWKSPVYAATSFPIEGYDSVYDDDGIYVGDEEKILMRLDRMYTRIMSHENELMTDLCWFCHRFSSEQWREPIWADIDSVITFMIRF